MNETLVPVRAGFVRPGNAGALGVLLFLAGCGGGGGDGEPVEALAGSELPTNALPTNEVPVEDGVPFGQGNAIEGGDADALPTTEPAREPATLPRADVREVDTAYAYRTDSPWADVLADCARADEVDAACTLDVLPFIAQATDRPTVDDVMDRVVVTHDWMGERFEELLDAAPDGLLQLFAATTSVIVGSTVRPSFYTGITGGIQLDPDYLWLTAAEKANVSIDEDYRAGFGDALAFRSLFGWWRDGDYAYEYFPLDDDSERTPDQANGPLMRLLFHELSHANDFLPPGTARFIDASMVPADALEANSENWLSPQLEALYPQSEGVLVDLADVRYGGTEATAEQSAATADYVGSLFEGDGAADFYSYRSIREDFALLFETAMMKALYDIDRSVAFTDQPADPDDYSCDELTVGWGARKRLGDASVTARAGWVVSALYGRSDAVDGFVTAQEGTEELMAVGTDWCTNLRGDAPAATRSRAGQVTDDERLRSREMSDAERHAIATRRLGRPH